MAGVGERWRGGGGRVNTEWECRESIGNNIVFYYNVSELWDDVGGGDGDVCLH